MSAGKTILYHWLAEALAEPPDWLCQVGSQWPLYEAVYDAARYAFDPLLHEIKLELAVVPPEGLEARRNRYHALMRGGIQAHESLARFGRLAGPTTFAIAAIYRAAGLVTNGAELPDSASVELAFLAYLTEREAAAGAEAARWRSARRLFVERHAGQWLPAMGESLRRTGDPVYAPIGRLLAWAIRNEQRRQHGPMSLAKGHLPVLAQTDDCNLCGFCANVCPTRALAVVETRETTTLCLIAEECTRCRRCERVCPVGVLRIAPPPDPQEDVMILRHSPRLHCPACGRATVSQVEMQTVVERLGKLAWLDNCLQCRVDATVDAAKEVSR